MDYAPIVIRDCVDTVDGPDFHTWALSCIERAFGWVITADEALRAVAGEHAVTPAVSSFNSGERG